MSLSGRPRRCYHPKASHLAVVDESLYPPKVTSERVLDDFGTDGNKRRNGSKVMSLRLTCLNTCKITTIGKGTVRCRACLSFYVLIWYYCGLNIPIGYNKDK